MESAQDWQESELLDDMGFPQVFPEAQTTPSRQSMISSLKGNPPPWRNGKKPPAIGATPTGKVVSSIRLRMKGKAPHRKTGWDTESILETPGSV